MHVMMVTPRYLPEMGGIETHVHEVSQRLAKRGHRVSILTTDRSGDLLPDEMIDDVRVRRVRAWPKQRDYYVAPALHREIMAADCDVMHLQGYHTFVAPLAMASALRKRIPYVVTFHSGGHSSGLRNLLRWPQHRLLAPYVRRAAHCIGVSQFEAAFFKRRMLLQQCSVIPNGAQMVPPTDALLPMSGPLVVSIGRLERYKGHHRLIEALPDILRQVPDARLRVLGDGPYKPQLLALIARLGLQDRVAVAGVPATDRAGVAEVLSSAALVALLSDYEAHPVAVMEALALRRRVLVTASSGFCEMVDHDVVEAVPIKASAATIATAVLAQLGKGPVLTPIALPTWDDCAERLAEVYHVVSAAPYALAGVR